MNSAEEQMKKKEQHGRYCLVLWKKKNVMQQLRNKDEWAWPQKLFSVPTVCPNKLNNGLYMSLQ